MLGCVCKNQDRGEGIKEEKPVFKHSKQLEKLLTQPQTRKQSSPDPDAVKLEEMEGKKFKTKLHTTWPILRIIFFKNKNLKLYN